MGDEVAVRRDGLAGLLVAHWPSLPHLAFGGLVCVVCAGLQRLHVAVGH